MNSLNFLSFVFNNISYGDLYENNYVEYTNDIIKFSNEKRNLVTIYVESLENSVFDKSNGGTVNDSYMPQLESLTKEYINFSHKPLNKNFQCLF